MVTWYVDGFNLYHAVAALKRPLLKWLDIDSLARSYLDNGNALGAVHYFTALNTWDADKRRRHMNDIRALQHSGVIVHLSRFDRIDKYCRKTGKYCVFNEEKQADVGIAVQALSDAYDGHTDILFFLTADSDQVPTLRSIKRRFPEKKVFLVAPPHRLSHLNGAALLGALGCEVHRDGNVVPYRGG
jgi:uncharacterized LabA/DUF88 family protein